MNKSAETLAEEYGIGPSSSPSDWQYIQKYFIAGHHSRDEEVNKLVEVLDELLKDRIWEPHWDKAKEALKPYLK